MRSVDVLEVAGLTVSYGRNGHALTDVDVVVEEGSSNALLGTNGAGKSTLLRAISATLGLHGGSIRGGRISIDGMRIDRRPAAAIVKLGIIQVPEGRRLFPQMSVWENLRAGGLRTQRARRAESLDLVCSLFPVLRDRAGQAAGLLSGGEQQMLAIGRALMARPRVLMLDEPSLGLAPKAIEHVMGVLADLHAAGTTIILAEQNARQALGACRQVFVLTTGRVTHHGSARQALDDGVVEDLLLGRRSRIEEWTRS